MLKNWLLQILEPLFVHLHSRINEIEDVIQNQHTSLAIIVQAQSAQLERIEQQLERLEQHQSLMEGAESSTSSVSDERPLPLTRSSWPRMKRMLEERDVRKELESQREQDVIVTQGRQMNRDVRQELNFQANAVADYWTRKQSQS